MVKDQIVTFLRIQVRVHHPGGRHTDEEGAWSANDALWKVTSEPSHAGNYHSVGWEIFTSMNVCDVHN